MHTRVVGKLCEASARSALEIYFEFREERVRWGDHNRIKAQKGKLSQEDTLELLNTLSKEPLQGVH